MNYIILGVATVLTALLLSLKSMKEFLGEIRSPHAQPQASTEDTTTPTEHPPIILDENPAIAQSLLNYIENTKSNPTSDLVIEKIYLNNTYQLIIYPPHAQSIWSSERPDGYIVIENQTLIRPQTLAQQFIIRHKYNDVYYCSFRTLEKKPELYVESGVDEVLWDQFYGRKQTQNPVITISQRIVSHILNYNEKEIRRTSS